MQTVHVQLDAEATKAIRTLRRQFGQRCSLSAITRVALRQLAAQVERADPMLELVGNTRSRTAAR